MSNLRVSAVAPHRSMSEERQDDPYCRAFEQRLLRINLFGVMQVETNGAVLPRTRTKKGYWLLALLTLRRGRETQREALAKQLWPESLDSQARANLNLSLTDLRKVLGAEAYRLVSGPNGGIRFVLDGAECDVLDFDRRINSTVPECLEQAVALYKGPLLADCPEDWILLEREQREQDYLRALQSLSEAAQARHDTQAALGYLRRIVQQTPSHDTARMHLMSALASGGNPYAALQVYQEFVRVLRRNDPRALPGEDIRQLYRHIRSEAQRQAAPPDAPPFKADPLSTSSTIPTRITPLIGRDHEISRIAAALRQSRLVSLTGAGGVGKTSLAIAVAQEMAAEYPAGAVFVALEDLTDLAEIPLRTLSALGVKPIHGQTPAETLTQFLSDKALLLVLDNLEHLLPDGTASVQQILRRCPGITLLLTSRRPLGTAGEVVWRIDPLSFPDPHLLPSDDAAVVPIAQKSPAVHLFIERARAKRADFQLTSQNVRAVIETCSRLDGLPFAIELAAAQTVALPIHELVRRLDDCFRVLKGSDPTALPRHRTLIASIDWSFHLLSAAEQTLLSRLSVCVGGCTLETAEAICTDDALNPSAVLDLLTSLVNQSMAIYEEYEGTARYRLPNTVRQYASERLQSSGRSAEYRARHAACLLALVEAQELLRNPVDQVAALDRLETEHDNIEAALCWSAQSPETLEIACRLAAALPRFWLARGHLLTGLRWFDILTPVSSSLPKALQSKLLSGADLIAGIGRKTERHQADRATDLEIYRGLDDSLDTAKSLLMKSRNRLLCGIQMVELLQESLEIFRPENGLESAAQALCEIGVERTDEPGAVRRIAWIEEDLRLDHLPGDGRSIVLALGGLGYAMLSNDGDKEAIRALFEEMLAWSGPLKDPDIQAKALFLLGHIEMIEQDYVAARRYYAEGLELVRRQGVRTSLVTHLIGMAEAEWCLGQLRSARTVVEETIQIHRRRNDALLEAKALQLLAKIEQRPHSE